MRRFEEKQVTLPYGRHLGYRYWPGRGRPLVVLHGLMDSAEGWDLLAESLSRPVYAFDLPGFGNSDLPERPRLSSYSLDISRAISKLDIKDFILVGHSLGGGIAAVLANNSKRVKHLILMAPVGFGYLPVAEALSAPGVSHVTSVFIPLILRNTLVFNTVYSTVISHRKSPRPELSSRIKTGARSSGAASAVRAVSYVSKHPLSAEPRRYKGPVTVVWGQRDLVVPKSHSKGVLKAFPQAQLLEWPGVGHHPQHENPQAMKELIESVASGKTARAAVPALI